MALTIQQGNNNMLSTTKETILAAAMQNRLEEISTFHKVIRILWVIILTIMGITATILFIRNILYYQHTRQLKSCSTESNFQPTTLTDEKTDEETKNIPITSIDSNIGSEPRSIDFPTLIPSKSRSSAGQDDVDNIISLTHKRQLGWDDVEMMRHGLISRDCERATLPESITVPAAINSSSKYGSKIVVWRETDSISATSKSVQNIHSEYSDDFHEPI
uniref:Uncharacterized protein n=1 Tax=Setaria digitata TaxID=48799 RepID=A0A915PN39_9BILA